jgi:nucleotide-binding universal stress UspA family protein
MKTILVPTDFSIAACNAAEYAVQLAKEIKASVTLLHVFHAPTPSSEVPMILIDPEKLQLDNEAHLKKEAKYPTKKTGVEVKYIAKMGLAVDEIKEEEKKFDLIVMGMKGASKLSEALIGSTATTTMRKVKRPLLIIPEKVTYKNPEKIVMASDYDPRIDEHALDVLRDFTRYFGSKILVVNVKSKKYEFTSEKELEKTIEGKLSNLEHTYYFPEKEDLVEGINEFIKDRNADMLAIIPHRYNFFERVFHNSVSKKMAFHTNVPLLALPDNHKSVAAYFL